MTPLPEPVNRVLSAVNTAIDFLVQGLGENVAIAAATTAAPFLAAPIINQVFRLFVKWLGGMLNVIIERNIDSLVIRFQSAISKDTFDQIFNKLKQDEVTPGVDPDDLNKDIQAAKDAADNLIHGGH